jgi:hypothetical protein
MTVSDMTVSAAAALAALALAGCRGQKPGAYQLGAYHEGQWCAHGLVAKGYDTSSAAGMCDSDALRYYDFSPSELEDFTQGVRDELDYLRALRTTPATVEEEP